MKQKIKRMLFLTLSLAVVLCVSLYAYFQIDYSIYKHRLIEMDNNNELVVNMASLVKHKTLKYDQYDIHYYLSGNKNSDLIIFLHPAFSNHHAFDQQIDFFSKNYRVISIDMIGHGLSQPNKSIDQIDKSIAHIKEIIDLENKKSVHLVGVSLGALMAQYFALHYPNSVKSLTALGGYDINKKSAEVAKAQSSINFKLIIRAVFSMNAFRQKVSEMTCYTKKGTAIFFGTTQQFTRQSFKLMQGIKNIVKNRENINPIYPTLILAGEHDIELAKKMSENWHTSNQNSQYIQLKNARHCANIDQPEAFNKLVFDFIVKNTGK